MSNVRSHNSSLQSSIINVAGTSIKDTFTKRVNECALMFIRFASGEVDPDACVPVGLFNALDQLYWSDEVPEYERQALREIEDWLVYYEDEAQVFARPTRAVRRLLRR